MVSRADDRARPASDAFSRGASGGSNLRQLWPFIARHKAMLAGWLLSLLASSGAMLGIPFAVRRVVDEGFAGLDRVDPAFFALLAVVVLLAVTTAARHYFIVLLGERAIAGLRRHFYAHLLRMDQAFFDVRSSGELVSRLSADIELLRGCVGSSLPVLARNSVMLTGSVALLVATNPRLAALALVGIPFCIVPLAIGGRLLGRISRTSQDRVADANSMAIEILGQMPTVRANAREDWEATRFAQALDRVLQAAARRIGLQAGLTGLGIAVVFGAMVMVVWVGAHDVLHGRMSAGELGQFMLYAFFGGAAVGALADVSADLQRAAGGMGRISEILLETPRVREPAIGLVPTGPVRGVVEFDDVWFSYPSRPGMPALRGVSLRVEPGQTVALVGPSGAGKTTLLHLLLRFYDADSGAIRIDGVDVRDMTLAGLRSRIAIVPQQPGIFAASVRANIGYGRPAASDGELRRAAEAANALAFVEALPDGFDETLGERGARLSGGQQQRIAIARALLKDAPVLLLDEATSALDSRSEQAVQDAIEGLKKGRTTLVVAHRLATVVSADRILVVDDGRVVAQGTHAELVHGGGVYLDLVSRQLLR